MLLGVVVFHGKAGADGSHFGADSDVFSGDHALNQVGSVEDYSVS